MPRPMPHQTDKKPVSEPGPPPGAIVVEINDTQRHIAVDRDELAALAARVLHGEGIRQASISIALVDDAAIHRVNRAAPRS